MFSVVLKYSDLNNLVRQLSSCTLELWDGKVIKNRVLIVLQPFYRNLIQLVLDKNLKEPDHQ